MEQAYRAALALHPGDADAAAALAQIGLSRGDPDAALDDKDGAKGPHEEGYEFVGTIEGWTFVNLGCAACKAVESHLVPIYVDAKPSGAVGKAFKSAGVTVSPVERKFLVQASGIVADFIAGSIATRVAVATYALLEGSSVADAVGFVKRIFTGAREDAWEGSLGAARWKPRVLQRGGRTISRRTADALNEFGDTTLNRREWGRALEALKRENTLPPKYHGAILENGDYVDHSGEFIDNLFDYVHGG